jgi:shikimate dehydrogenase
MTRCLVVGQPIGHSLSPVLHRAAYAALGLDWSYDAIEVAPGSLASLLDRERPRGVSVTMPLKAEAYALARTVSPLAAQVGVANTLVARTRLGGEPDGEAGRGYDADNTDVTGVVASLAEAGLTSLSGSTVVLAGAGGTAQAVVVAAAMLGCAQVTVLARSVDRARKTLTATAGRAGMRLEFRELSADAFGRPDLLVSTTPAGALDPYADAAARARVVFDVLYHPWPTALVRAAEASGAVVVGGLSLLVHQAARQVELMTGRSPAPVPAMRAAGAIALAERAGR